MRRKRKPRTPEILARVFEAIVLFITAAMILTAGGILLLHLFGVQTYIVMSGSMEPEIHTGAVALIDTTDQYAEKGDVIAYRLGEGDEEILITHRVIQKTMGGYITKGDANETEDDREVMQDQVVGTFLTSVPKVGFAIDTLGRRGLFGIVLWVTSLNILSSLLRDLTARRPKRRRSSADHDNGQRRRSSPQGRIAAGGQYR